MTKRQRYYYRHRERLLRGARASYVPRAKREPCEVQKLRAIDRKTSYKLRKDVFQEYGGHACACPGCKIKEPLFLTIDHIAGSGQAVHKRLPGHKFYRWLKRNNYPPGYRVLCHNCNSGRGRRDVVNSLCPMQGKPH